MLFWVILTFSKSLFSYMHSKIRRFWYTLIMDMYNITAQHNSPLNLEFQRIQSLDLSSMILQDGGHHLAM